MEYIVSITSQGQISIPAKIRKELNLNKFKKAYVKSVGDKMIIEPIKDIMSLAGSLSKYAKKGKDINKIIKLENIAIGEALIDRYKQKETRSSNNLLIVKP